ncbi:MAG TPA: cyclase family protein [Anaerolineaceae bacterium]
MQIHDITLTIHPDMPVWTGDPKVVLERVRKMEDGENCNVSRLDMSVHTGTHVDAPYHFLLEGNTVEYLSLDTLVGSAMVFEMPADCGLITAKALKETGFPRGVERVLIKTRNSAYWNQPGLPFQTDFVSVSADGAELLVKYGVKLIGIDYLSVAPYRFSRPTHEILLKAGVVVLEGVNLAAINPGIYQLICLPLKLARTDGSPARALLIEE